MENESEKDIDFELEPNEELGDLSGAQNKLKQVKEKLKACETEKQDYLNNWQKERADFINYKKEEGERFNRNANYIREKFIEDLLPILDSFDLAMQNKEAWEKVEKNWRMGVEYIHQQFLKVFSEYGVLEIKTKEGDAFDPNLHQSIETIKTPLKEKDHTIAQIIQKGYISQGKTLRPARVNVFEYKE